ncbi:MAG: LysR family transcriptional regulator [Pseudomonadota bacterium]
MLTLKDLELVRSVAHTGSLSAAAKSLHISQSAASQRLSSLRDRLDVEVFDRTGGVLRLTSAGNRLLVAAEAVSTQIRSALNDLAELRVDHRPHLSLTTQCYTCYRWLPFIIRGLSDEHTDLTVDVVPEATDRPYDALASRDVDLAIVSNPQLDARFESHDLFVDELFAVVHRDHPLAARKHVSAARLAQEPLIVYTGAKHAVVEEVLKPAGISDYRLIQVRITEALIELARAGRGVAVIAGWALDDIPDTEALQPVRITRSGFKRTWRAVTAKQADAKHVASFLKHMRRIGRHLKRPDWRSTLRTEFPA